MPRQNPTEPPPPASSVIPLRAVAKHSRYPSALRAISTARHSLLPAPSAQPDVSLAVNTASSHHPRVPLPFGRHKRQDDSRDHRCSTFSSLSHWERDGVRAFQSYAQPPPSSSSPARRGHLLREFTGMDLLTGEARSARIQDPSSPLRQPTGTKYLWSHTTLGCGEGQAYAMTRCFGLTFGPWKF